ncbi:MAG: CDP-alcohol phosphatidyltransferase family protein [Chloroflexi bacterium]|nr:CDP-alcohol phosphatidyltransferase family protein [Chloroflexota bacterium]
MASVYDGIVSRHVNRRLSRPIARLLAHTPVTPNQVSVLSLAIAAGAFVSFLYGLHIVGGLLAQLSSIVDGVDGDLARLTGSSSRFGGFLDAVIDRYSDSLILLGVSVWAASGDDPTFAWVAGFAALAGSFAVTYTRARIDEGHRTLFDRGLASLASRDVRLLIVMIGGVAGIGIPTLVLIALLTNIVVILRVVQARSALK